MCAESCCVYVQVDRRSLPRHQFEATAEYVAPSNHVEAAVCSAWQQILQKSEPISVHANFFELGGNSLSTAAVCTLVRKELALEQDIPGAWLFTHQTIRSLSDKIWDDLLGSGVPRRAPLLPTVSGAAAGDGTVAPTLLSFQQVRPSCPNSLCLGYYQTSCHRHHAMGSGSSLHCLPQEQFLQLWQQDPASAAYNTPWGVRLLGNLDTNALQHAVRLLADRHLVRCS